MIGWRILREGEYKLNIPVLSEDEEKLILATEHKFKEVTRSSSSEHDTEKLLSGILSKVAQESGIYLEHSQENYLSEVAFMHIYGFAFLEPIIADSEVEEISIIGPLKPAYVYIRNVGWKSVNACFENERGISDMINRLGRSLGRHITMQNPRLDAMLPDRSRLHASLPPVSEGEITIRKFRPKPFSPNELVKNSLISCDAMALLSILMQSDKSLIIAGNTASGKTSTLNGLFSFVPGNDRVIITEETPEINIPHKHQLRMIANREMGITLKDLVYDSLRMRPDRMIVGEVRSKGEAEALFDVLLAGQARGNYATFHAQSATEALSRLRSFGINENDLRSIDCILIQRRMSVYDRKKRRNREIRKVVEIAEVEGGAKLIYQNGKVVLGKLVDDIGESLGLSRKEILAELSLRKKLIEKGPNDFGEFYELFQEKIYGIIKQRKNDLETGGYD